MNNDYSGKDFTSIYEDLLSIVEASTTLWNPRYSTEADPGVVILKAMALLEDKSNYRFDMSRAQAYLDTVSDRTSAYDLLSMLGYIMQGRRAAEGFITVKNTSSSPYTIPQFSVVTNPTKEVLFFTKDDVAVSAGESVSVPVQAGTIFQVVKQGIAEFTLKDIDEKGRLFLSKTNLAQNGVYVRSSTPSTKWVYLDYVLLQDSSTYYTVGTSATGEMYVQFPDNYMSLIGNDKLTVYATYTNGANSNIAKNVLSTFSDNQKDASGQVQLSAVFSVFQTEDIYSGQDEETIDHAVQTYYETKDVCSTLITAQDFTTALRYLLISNTRAFSNVIVETPQTKTKRMMTSQQGVSYIQLVQPEDLDFNRIDVLPTKFSAEYYPSFKPYLTYSDDSYASEKAKLETQIDQKLIDKKALPIKINIAGFDGVDVDKSIQPIFATFSPLIYVYLRDSSITQQVVAREAIKRYFHTTYNMKNLVPGSPLSETKIAEDIKKLSTNIIDVTVVPLDYTMAQFTPTYLSNPTAQFSANYSLSKLSDAANENLRRSILQDAVLAGDVPLFKFTNRQNSYSKTNSLYSRLTKDEQVLPIPWGASDYSIKQSFDNGCYLYAKAILGSDYHKSSHTLTVDEMIQIRRPLFTQVQDHVWGQGMRWTYSLTPYTASKPITEHVGKLFTFYVDLNGDKGLSLPDGTTFTPASEFSFEGDLTSYFSSPLPTVVGSKSTFAKGTTYTVSKELKFTGGYLPLSDFKLPDTTKVTYYLHLPGTKIASGSTYVMQEGETLTVQKASTPETVDTYTAGKPILLTGLDITRAPSATDVLSSAMTTISLMEPKSYTISVANGYVYFLCLNSKSSTKDITPTTPYTLEEGEYFIYADAGVTEYVTLGPGTELTLPTGSISLKVHNNYDIASVLPSDFEPLPSSIDANFYEITTFAEGSIIQLGSGSKFSDLFKPTEPTDGVFVPSWVFPEEGKTLTVKVTTKDGSYTIYNISSVDYSIRHLAVLRTTEKGYALTSSTIFDLSYTNPDGTENSIIFSPYNDTYLTDNITLQTRFYSSIALSAFAGSLLTTSPFSCTSVTVDLVKNSQGIYEEQLSQVPGSKIQGVRITSDSTVPSPYDLSLSYTGSLSSVQDNPNHTVVATFAIPALALTNGALFKFRHTGGTEDSSVKFKISLIYKLYGQDFLVTKDLATISDTSKEEFDLSLADYVFVIPKLGNIRLDSSSQYNPRLSISLYSNVAYPKEREDYSFQAAIEDISILHSETPFDPQLGLTLAKSGSDVVLPTQLGGSDNESEAYKLLQKLVSASNSAVAQSKAPFNWLYYSLDRLSNPLDPQSFFLPAHPKNSKVFPLYIEDATRIKFPQRG